MANTRYLTVEVENFVRDRLSEQYGRQFQKRRLALITGGMHEFDAVSDDDHIVASIKAISGKTSTGKVPSAKYQNAIAEIYYLSLVTAERRVLVLTYPPFRDLLLKKIEGALVDGVEID